VGVCTVSICVKGVLASLDITKSRRSLLFVEQFTRWRKTMLSTAAPEEGIRSTGINIFSVRKL
jgi:hypothetical protein